MCDQFWWQGFTGGLFSGMALLFVLQWLNFLAHKPRRQDSLSIASWDDFEKQKDGVYEVTLDGGAVTMMWLRGGQMCCPETVARTVFKSIKGKKPIMCRKVAS